MTTPLSLAAQSVLTAIHAAPDNTRDSYRSAGRRRLRAAADQVEQKLRGFSREACQEIRAIAAELEGHQ
jgi:hypothetical protein